MPKNTLSALLCAAVFCLLTAHPALAADTPMGEVLCAIIDMIHGNLGRGLATLGVITLGVGALLGKVSWGMAITVGIGTSVIFGAEQIATLLLGVNAYC